MMRKLLLALAPITIALSVGLHAQTMSGDEGDREDVYAKLVDTWMPEAGLQKVNANLIDDVRAAYHADEEVHDLDAQCPGLIDATIETMIPFLSEYDAIELRLRRAAAIQILSEELSISDARAATEFYASELGQKLVLSVMSNYSLENTLTVALDSDDDEVPIEGAALESDKQNAVRAGINALSPDQRAEIERQLEEATWGPAIARLRPKISAAGLAISNSDFAPEVDKRMDQALDETIEAHLEKCDF